jgi:hypothetical protein
MKHLTACYRLSLQHSFWIALLQKLTDIRLTKKFTVLNEKARDLLPCAQQDNITTLKTEALLSLETSCIMCPTARTYNLEELCGKSDEPFLNHRY